MSHSRRTAADHADVSKTNKFRAIKAGRLSAPFGDHGGSAIGQAELFHAYAPSDGRTIPATAAGLEAAIQEMKELVRLSDLDKQDLKADRDTWKFQAEATQRLLTMATMTTHPKGQRLFACFLRPTTW